PQTNSEPVVVPIAPFMVEDSNTSVDVKTAEPERTSRSSFGGPVNVLRKSPEGSANVVALSGVPTKVAAVSTVAKVRFRMFMLSSNLGRGIAAGTANGFWPALPGQPPHVPSEFMQQETALYEKPKRQCLRACA